MENVFHLYKLYHSSFFIVYYRINIVTQTVQNSNLECSDDEMIVYLGDGKPVTIKQNQRSRNPSENKNKQTDRPKENGKKSIKYF